MPHALAAFHQAQITDDAITPVAHPGELGTFETVKHPPRIH
jgi:hypothetical protein